jgi:hypothetical protein
MSASEALKAARAAGIELGIDGDDLVLEASAPPPDAVLNLLSLHKAGIMTLLRPGDDGWSAEDWQVFFDERASIAEFDGCLPRVQAEGRAFACCVEEWLNRNPVHSPPGRCLACGGGHHGHDPLLPFGIESTLHAWLHSRCWPAWYAARKVEAVAALKAMGIAASTARNRESGQQCDPPPADIATEQHSMGQQFAFRRQMNGG